MLYFICFILGAIISLFLYACIIVGAKQDKEVVYIENTKDHNKINNQ